MIPLQRCVMRLPAPTIDRLTQIAEAAGVDLRCEVSRSAVVRAALTVWLDSAEEVNPAHVLEAIRVAMVKRGRKGKPQ